MNEQVKEPEVIEKEIEVVGAQAGIVEGTGQDDIDSLMFLADNIDKIIEAKNKIRTALYRLAKPGDWTIFTSEKDIKEGKEATAELGHAGAMRISSTVGISFANWTARKENGVDDKGPWYRYDVECDVNYRGNKIRAYGRAGTRDKFFGKAYGEMKELSEINEGDIKIAAIRSAMKEGVKSLLGLHHIPAKELESLGVKMGQAKSYAFKNADTGEKENGEHSETDENKMRAEIGNWLIEIYGKDKAPKMLKMHTEFTNKDGDIVDGLLSCKDIKGVRLNIAHNKIKKAYENFKSENGGK